MATAERGLRADAQRNLAHILEAARQVFAEQGLEASVAEVAERAGVGTATIFRRFPTKHDLLAAVVEQRLGEIAERALHAAASRDASKAFRHFMQEAVESFIGDRGFCEAGPSGLLADPEIRARIDEITASVERVLERAQAAGEVRRDVTSEDIPVLLSAVAQAGLSLEHVTPGIWRRYLDLALDGLHPDGARPLSRKAPTRRQIDASRGDRPAAFREP